MSSLEILLPVFPIKVLVFSTTKSVFSLKNIYQITLFYSPNVQYYISDELLRQIYRNSAIESPFKDWFNRFFCIGPQSNKRSSNKQNSLKPKPKQTIHLSLVGSYNASTLCKMTRRNFIADSRQLGNQRLPSVVSKFLAQKISATTVLIKGQISGKVVRKIPMPIRLISQKQKPIGECIVGDIKNIKLRMKQFCIVRPLLNSSRTPSLFDQDKDVGEQIYNFVSKFENSIFILPANTVLDQIGILLFDVSKFVEIQTIVVNGIPSWFFVYVGTSDFVLMSQQEQVTFVVKELQKDLKEYNNNLLELVERILKRSSMMQLLFLLKKSITDAYIDTVLTCFLQHAVFRNYISQQQISELLPCQSSQNERETPIFRTTGRFNLAVSLDRFSFKESMANGFLNGLSNSLRYQNQIETFAETIGSVIDVSLKAEYNPL